MVKAVWASDIYRHSTLAATNFVYTHLHKLNSPLCAEKQLVYFAASITQLYCLSSQCEVFCFLKVTVILLCGMVQTVRHIVHCLSYIYPLSLLPASHF